MTNTGSEPGTATSGASHERAGQPRPLHAGPQAEPRRRLGGHGLLMALMCLPLLVVAVVLVLMGLASPVVVLAAVTCTVMMALMMRGMHDR